MFISMCQKFGKVVYRVLKTLILDWEKKVTFYEYKKYASGMRQAEKTDIGDSDSKEKERVKDGQTNGPTLWPVIWVRAAVDESPSADVCLSDDMQLRSCDAKRLLLAANCNTRYQHTCHYQCYINQLLLGPYIGLEQDYVGWPFLWTVKPISFNHRSA